MSSRHFFVFHCFLFFHFSHPLMPRATVLALLAVLDVLTDAAETGWKTPGFAVSCVPDSLLLRRACGGRFQVLANSLRYPRIDRRMNAARLAMNKGEKKIAKGRCIPSLTHSYEFLLFVPMTSFSFLTLVPNDVMRLF